MNLYKSYNWQSYVVANLNNKVCDFLEIHIITIWIDFIYKEKYN